MKGKHASQTLKRLAKDLAGHPVLLFLAFLGTIAQVALSIYLPILIGQVIDQVLVDGSSQLFWQIFLQMILVVIWNTLVQWANPLLYNRLIFSYTKDLREKIIEKLHRLPIALVDRQGSGEMVSRVTTDIEQLAAGLNMIFNQFFIGVDFGQHPCYAPNPSIDDSISSALNTSVYGHFTLYRKEILPSLSKADRD